MKGCDKVLISGRPTGIIKFDFVEMAAHSSNFQMTLASVAVTGHQATWPPWKVSSQAEYGTNFVLRV